MARRSRSDDAGEYEVDRVEAGITDDPGDWMAYTSISDPDEMNEPDESIAGEEALSEGSGDVFSQSAIELIRGDHLRVEELFEQYEAAGDMPSPDASMIIEQVCLELLAHAQIEEEVLYPAIQAVADEDTRDFIEQSLVDHMEIERLVSELRELEAGPEQDDAFRSLIAEVTAHVEQEESMLLPYAEDMLGDKLVDIGEQILERKNELTSAPASLPGNTRSKKAKRNNAPTLNQ